MWLVREPLALGKSYLLKIGAKTTPASVSAVTARIEIESGLPAPLLTAEETLAFNAIGEAELTLDLAVVCDPYVENCETGGFILIDRITNETVAVGMVTGARNSERGAPALLEASYSSMEGLPTPPAPLLQSRRRSLVKALSWRVLGSVLTFIVVFGFSRDTSLALAVTATEMLAKIALYDLHEQIWARHGFGMSGGASPTPEDDAGL